MGETKKTIPLLGAPEQLQAALPYLQDRSDNFKALAAPILAACQKYAKFYPEAIEARWNNKPGPWSWGGSF